MQSLAQLAWVPWVLAGASLLWNLVNTWRTQAIRHDTVRLEEFRRVRTPIDAALIALRKHERTLGSLSKSAADSTSLRETATTVNKAMAEAYVELQSALEDANASQYAHGDDWLTPAEAAWESAVDKLGSVHNPGYTDERTREAVAGAALKLAEIVREVNKRIDKEVRRFG